MRKALIITGCLGLVLSSCGDKRGVRAAVPTSVSAAEEGIASWYGNPYHGRAAANGEIYDMEKLTAAHRTLPFGTWVRVYDLDTGKNVEVRITDRGPFVDDRVIDLSRAAARAIDMIGPGTARVRLEIMASPATFVPGIYSVQVGAFQYRQNAERLRLEMESRYGAARLVFHDGRPALWRVLVGKAATLDAAGGLAERIRGEQDGKLAQSFVVRDDAADRAAAN